MEVRRNHSRPSDGRRSRLHSSRDDPVRIFGKVEVPLLVLDGHNCGEVGAGLPVTEDGDGRSEFGTDRGRLRRTQEEGDGGANWW